MYKSNNSYKLLFKEADGSYSIPTQPENKVRMSIAGKDTVVDFITPQETFHLVKYRDIQKTDEMLSKYTGTYYCPELEVHYTIFLKDHELYLGHIKYNDSRLQLVATDHMDTNLWWMGHLLMLRDKKGAITGFEINSGRVEHVRFDKIK